MSRTPSMVPHVLRVLALVIFCACGKAVAVSAAAGAAKSMVDGSMHIQWFNPQSSAAYDFASRLGRKDALTDIATVKKEITGLLNRVHAACSRAVRAAEEAEMYAGRAALAARAAMIFGSGTNATGVEVAVSKAEEASMRAQMAESTALLAATRANTATEVSEKAANEAIAELLKEYQNMQLVEKGLADAERLMAAAEEAAAEAERAAAEARAAATEAEKAAVEAENSASVATGTSSETKEAEGMLEEKRIALERARKRLAKAEEIVERAHNALADAAARLKPLAAVASTEVFKSMGEAQAAVSRAGKSIEKARATLAVSAATPMDATEIDEAMGHVEEEAGRAFRAAMHANDAITALQGRELPSTVGPSQADEGTGERTEKYVPDPTTKPLNESEGVRGTPDGQEVDNFRRNRTESSGSGISACMPVLFVSLVCVAIF